MILHTTINGRRRQLEIDPRESLLDLVRRLGLKGAHFGCGDGECGACTVLLDGHPVTSCLVLAARVEDREVTTIEGLGSVQSPHPLQRHFVDTGAIQCGYSSPASILCAAALLAHNPDPTEADIRIALDGVLCRCTGYVKKIEAIQRAVAELKAAVASPAQGGSGD